MWCWRRIEKFIWTDFVTNEDVLLGIKEEGNILIEIKLTKSNWIGHILRKNCLLKHVIEENIIDVGDEKIRRQA
jgi:hypothetical protein